MSQASVGEWEARRSGRSSRRARYLLGAVVLLAGIAALWLALKGQAHTGVQQLPEAERQQLFRRTLEDLRLCATGSGALIPEHCAHQANLAEAFAECDTACRDLASHWEKRPTR